MMEKFVEAEMLAYLRAVQEHAEATKTWVLALLQAPERKPIIVAAVAYREAEEHLASRKQALLDTIDLWQEAVASGECSLPQRKEG